MFHARNVASLRRYRVTTMFDISIFFFFPFDIISISRLPLSLHRYDVASFDIRAIDISFSRVSLRFRFPFDYRSQPRISAILREHALRAARGTAEHTSSIVASTIPRFTAFMRIAISPIFAVTLCLPIVYITHARICARSNTSVYAHMIAARCRAPVVLF